MIGVVVIGGVVYDIVVGYVGGSSAESNYSVLNPLNRLEARTSQASSLVGKLTGNRY